jgi:hypothetical protein
VFNCRIVELRVTTYQGYRIISVHSVHALRACGSIAALVASTVTLNLQTLFKSASNERQAPKSNAPPVEWEYEDYLPTVSETNLINLLQKSRSRPTMLSYRH